MQPCTVSIIFCSQTTSQKLSLKPMDLTKLHPANALRDERVVEAKGNLFHVPEYPILTFIADKESVGKGKT